MQRDLNEIERWILMFITLALANNLTDSLRLQRMIEAAESVQNAKHRG